jgi:Tfp pilus assembly protein PilF
MLIALPLDGQTQAGVDAHGTPSVAESASDAGKQACASVEALSVEALIDYGFAALRAGNSAEARQYWTRALAREPDNRSLQFNLRKLDSAD